VVENVEKIWNQRDKNGVLRWSILGVRQKDQERGQKGGSKKVGYFDIGNIENTH
jgi:hypothetical protein